jgi:ribosomal protein S6
LETVTKQLYEGMFLVDVAKASSDWDGVISSLTKILEKAEAEIKSQSRGVYIICYFKVDGTKIQEIEKNIRLSEQVMRLLILNAEEMTQEDIEKDTPAMKTEKEGIKPEEEISEVIAEREDLEPAWNADESNSEIEEETEVADESELESETEEQA